MIVVITVSRRDGHVTFWPSARTSCMNLNGLTLAMTVPVAVSRKKPRIPNGYPPPHFTGRDRLAILFGRMFAAEVRNRAASDALYYCPMGRQSRRGPGTNFL